MGYVAAYLAIPGEIDLQGFGVVLEAKRSHSKQNVLAVDSLALFLLAFFGCWWTMLTCGLWRIDRDITFAGDERDELAHALLHAFLCFFGDFGIVGESRFHNARDWSKVTNVSI